MNKFLKSIYLLLMSLFIVAFLGACEEGTSSSSNTDQEDTSSISETEEDVSTASEDTEDTEDTEPIEPATVSSYRADVSSISIDFSETMGNFSDLTIGFSEDPNLLYDPNWIADIAAQILAMQDSLDAFRALDPPNEMTEIHEKILLAADEYQFVVDNFPTAIDTLNVDLINECTVHIQNGTTYISNATKMMEEYDQ